MRSTRLMAIGASLLLMPPLAMLIISFLGDSFRESFLFQYFLAGLVVMIFGALIIFYCITTNKTVEPS